MPSEAPLMRWLTLALSLLPVGAFAAGARSPAPHGKIVLVGFTGLEDPRKLIAPYKHALAMKKTGRLEAVDLVIYGRAVDALSTKQQVPPELDEAIRAVHAAGIPIFVCENALKAAHIPLLEVRSEATPIPSGAAKIAELVSEGFAPLQY